jgi:hypothetical protein
MRAAQEVHMLFSSRLAAAQYAQDQGWVQATLVRTRWGWVAIPAWKPTPPQAVPPVWFS